MHILFLILYQPLLNALVFLYNIIPGHDMGIAIIILTIIIRLILWPANAGPGTGGSFLSTASKCSVRDRWMA